MAFDAKNSAALVSTTAESGEFDSHVLIFYVNGRRVEEHHADPHTTLAVYLRDHLQLKGTKIGCNEGGCGACTIMISDIDPAKDDKIRHYSANACLTPLCAVFGKAVTTVEGIGGPLSTVKHLHPVQERLAKTHGSQCGYCTPGFVMAMYSLLRNDPNPSSRQVDECLQGNLCRCTGYRPILEAFYSFVPKPDGTARVLRDGRGRGENCCKNKNRLPLIENCDKTCASGCETANTHNGRCCKMANSGNETSQKCAEDDCKLADNTITNDNGVKQMKLNSFSKSLVKDGLKKSLQKSKILEDDKELIDRVEKMKLTTLEDCLPYDPSQEPPFPSELQVHKWHRRSLDYKAAGSRWLQPISLDHLLELKRRHPHARLISGNSELAVELKFRFIPLPLTINLKQIPELRQVRVDNAMGVFLGMGLSLSEVKEEITRILETQPSWKTAILRSVSDMLYYFAGKHVRNIASIAGNIATASPISDLNPIWMAAGARVLLSSADRGKRLAPVDETLFVGYRRTTIAADEVLVGIWIPFSSSTQYFYAYKQAQRREDDIAIVTGAFSVIFSETTTSMCLDNGERPHYDNDCIAPSTVKALRISYGGMAPTTKAASRRLCESFIGRRWDAFLLEELSARIVGEFRLPLDVPGGMAHYRLTLALSFLHKFHSVVTAEHRRWMSLNNGCEENENEESEHEDSHDLRFHTTQIYHDVPADQRAVNPVGRPLAHASGEKHTTGEAIYGTDIKVFDCLHLAYVMSPVAHGTIASIDVTEALALDGVVDYISASDVPGANEIGHGDTPIFARTEVNQPIGAIIANDHETARRAANLVKLEIIGQQPIITIEDAIKSDSYLLKQIRVHSSRAADNDRSQDVEEIQMDDDWSQKYENFVEGQIRMGGQEHFYLETQNCVVIPDEGGEIDVISSTQCVHDVQRDVSAALAVPRHRVRVSVRRIGGGFGGKESCCGMFAAAAAVAAVKLRRPVRVVLERFDDMAISGTRHPFRFDYRLAVDVKTRQLLDFRVNTYSNCGFALDLSRGVMERCLTHMDNVYRFANADFVGHLCRTHTSSNTAFRGFGGPQGMFVAETALKHAAEAFDIDVDELRAANFYVENDQTPFGMHLRQCNVTRCWAECLAMSDYAARRDGAVAVFNMRNRWRKRGIYATPTKFGVGFGLKQLNQAGALVHVYTDGSVLISHSGMEMGQGLHTKILQIAACCLGIDVTRVHIHDTATNKVPNASPTAASVGSDMNGLAVQDACRKIMERLKPFREAKPDAGWNEWVNVAYINRVSLSATGFGIIHSEAVDFMNGRGAELFGYCVYGTAVTEVEIDCLTGDHHVLRTDIVMDIGNSLNPAVDIGQIEGAFIQGYGLFTIEEIKMRSDGVRLTRGPGTYKIPSADDVPREFHVKLLKGSSNSRGIFSSKAVGEPPLFLGASALFAIREAIRAYRVGECGLYDYFRLDSPATPERIRMACTDEITKRVSGTTTSAEAPKDHTSWTVEL